VSVGIRRARDRSHENTNAARTHTHTHTHVTHSHTKSLSVDGRRPHTRVKNDTSARARTHLPREGCSTRGNKCQSDFSHVRFGTKKYIIIYITRPHIIYVYEYYIIIILYDDVYNTWACTIICVWVCVGTAISRTRLGRSSRRRAAGCGDGGSSVRALEREWESGWASEEDAAANILYARARVSVCVHDPAARVQQLMWNGRPEILIYTTTRVRATSTTTTTTTIPQNRLIYSVTIPHSYRAHGGLLKRHHRSVGRKYVNVSTNYTGDGKTATRTAVVHCAV